MTGETKIIASKDTPTIEIVREFDAPVEAVFRAHTDPELFIRWVGPNGMESRIDRWTCETGGNYRYMCGRTGDQEHWFHGSFHEVRPHERIVQTFTWEGMPESVALETLTLTDLGDGRCRLRSVSGDNTFEGRDAMLAGGMESGVIDGYHKLDALLV